MVFESPERQLVNTIFSTKMTPSLTLEEPANLPIEHLSGIASYMANGGVHQARCKCDYTNRSSQQRNVTWFIPFLSRQFGSHEKESTKLHIGNGNPFVSFYRNIYN